jgi:predicted nucleic acid-binding protein
MTAIYVESSALLSWLLGEPRAREAVSALNRAQTVVTSVLSLVEVERALNRSEHQHSLTAGQTEKLRGMLARGKAGWILMEISEEVRARACRTFPAEPLRTLDAIHLATALVFLRVFPDLRLLSFDSHILENARRLGVATSG